MRVCVCGDGGRVCVHVREFVHVCEHAHVRVAGWRSSLATGCKSMKGMLVFSEVKSLSVPTEAEDSSLQACDYCIIR